MTEQSNRRLNTQEAADFLTENGFRTAASSLTRWRCVGGGPKFDLFGRKPLYKPETLLEWARGKTRFDLRSTSEVAAESPKEENR